MFPFLSFMSKSFYRSVFFEHFTGSLNLFGSNRHSSDDTRDLRNALLIVKLMNDALRALSVVDLLNEEVRIAERSDLRRVSDGNDLNGL